jgi:hypothetical protein
VPEGAIVSLCRGRFRLPAVLLLLSGCAGVPTPVESRLPPEQARALVIVVDGAGGYQFTPRAVVRVVDEDHLPLAVRSFDWTHATGRWLADQVDQAHSYAAGLRLAAEVALYERQYPGLPVYLMAYSAGSYPLLTAASHLPPGSVERIILLAPAVSASYDLRPALACARQGIDVFSNKADRLYLGVGTAVLGTTDGCHDLAAGRYGFRPVAGKPADAALYAKLRDHPWERNQAWTGHRGQHSGVESPAFLRTFVVPLLLPGHS